MASLGDDRPARSAGRAHRDTGDAAAWFGVVGNERLTTLAGAVLLVLIVIELVTTAALHALLSPPRADYPPISLAARVLALGDTLGAVGEGWFPTFCWGRSVPSALASPLYRLGGSDI